MNAILFDENKSKFKCSDSKIYNKGISDTDFNIKCTTAIAYMNNNNGSIHYLTDGTKVESKENPAVVSL